MNYKNVVTSFIQSNQKILLLHRSAKVNTNQGKWGAVSGYLEADEPPFARAQIEIQEEVSLKPDQINLVRSGVPLRAFDGESETVWIVHPFLFTTHNTAVNIDWEHTEYRWIDPDELNSYETVPKLKETFDRVQWDLQPASQPLLAAFEMISGLGEDRVSGASSLGRQAVQIIAEAAKSSDAKSTDDLYRDMVALFLKSRTVQRSMATLRNMTGKLLYFAGLKRTNSKSLDDFRASVLELVRNTLSESERETEDASGNLASIIPQNAKILTHSYSTTVKRAFERISRQGTNIQVYVTESHPGYEGRMLAKDLIKAGLQAQIVPDSMTSSIIANLDAIVVGGDSVLADGSVVNKVGTMKIAAEAKSRRVPFYVVCETGKFSTANFLGEDIEIMKIFDVTSNDLIRTIVTELGPLEPSQVVGRIKDMLRELYT